MYRKSVFVFALAILIAGCSGNSQPTAEVTLNAIEFTYAPDAVVAQVGQPITITIANNGAKEHDFVIEKITVTDIVIKDNPMNTEHDMGAMKYDLHMATASGESNTITFTPTEIGAYVFFCTVQGHKEAGMVGTLNVVAE